jgi:alpha-beta hydrolase superfamily lysophospholipase
MHYLQWGSLSNRRRVLLLHDLGDAAGVLGGLGRSLSSQGFCALACDLRGHGDSTRSADAAYSCTALAEDLLSFVVTLVTDAVMPWDSHPHRRPRRIYIRRH